ncbi:MAG TPA: suppressor of fused domain protein [Pseudomonas sp.]|nr:suppressor of fused domain protein [Pseudomonas sp.]
MNIFKKFLASLKKPTPVDAQPNPSTGEFVQPQAPSEADTDTDAARQAVFEATHDCLDRHWQAIGAVEQDVLTYLISPSFSGGVPWPSTRQAYQIVRRDNSIILATQGLSAPFDDAEDMGNGFELELFIETADIPEHAMGQPGNVDPFRGSWTFELLEHVAKTVAGAGGIMHQLEQYGALSLELPGFSQSHLMSDQVPAHFVTDDDATGVLLGGPQPDFPIHVDGMPLSPVSLVPVVLITGSELEYVRTGGRQAREDLIQRLNAAGVGHRSTLRRDSVI